MESEEFSRHPVRCERVPQVLVQVLPLIPRRPVTEVSGSGHLPSDTRVDYQGKVRVMSKIEKACRRNFDGLAPCDSKLRGCKFWVVT
jgi:hypothetical protein